MISSITSSSARGAGSKGAAPGPGPASGSPSAGAWANPGAAASARAAANGQKRGSVLKPLSPAQAAEPVGFGGGQPGIGLPRRDPGVQEKHQVRIAARHGEGRAGGEQRLRERRVDALRVLQRQELGPGVAL